MWHLSREVRESPELTAAFEAGVAGLLERLRAEDDDDAAAFLDHLTASSRTTAPAARTSGTPYSDVWESQPELVLALVDRMRLAGDEQSPVARHDAVAADRDAATAEVLAGARRRRGHQGPPAGRAGLGPALHGLAGADQDQLRQGRPRAAHGPARARPASGRAGRARPAEAGVHAPGRRARRLRRRPGRVPATAAGSGRPRGAASGTSSRPTSSRATRACRRSARSSARATRPSTVGGVGRRPHGRPGLRGRGPGDRRG